MAGRGVWQGAQCNIHRGITARAIYIGVHISKGLVGSHCLLVAPKHLGDVEASLRIPCFAINVSEGKLGSTRR
jgi:hypothetical protein